MSSGYYVNMLWCYFSAIDWQILLYLDIYRLDNRSIMQFCIKEKLGHVMRNTSCQYSHNLLTLLLAFPKLGVT